MSAYLAGAFGSQYGDTVGNQHSTRRLVIPSEVVVSADVDEQAVLLNVDTGMYYGLDEVGARIWALMSQGKDVDAMVDALLEEYDTTAEQLKRDIGVFVDRLVQLELARDVGG